MYKSKIGKVIKSNTHGDAQEVVIKELSPLISWKSYKAELGVNYNELLGTDYIVQFLVDTLGNVIAVKDMGRKLSVKELYELRVR